jgi:GTP-dependent phosphoenolpyruvate carboxykinase
LDVAAPALEELLTVSPPAWRSELEAVGAYLTEFGGRVPPALHAELEDALTRVRGSA